MMRTLQTSIRPAVVYLARGAGEWRLPLQTFIRSYQAHPSGIEHDLFVIFKGFSSAEDRMSASSLFSAIPHTAIDTGDDDFDLGAYRASIDHISNETVCFLNTNSEIVTHGWLGKLAVHLDDDVGAVGATGSFESLEAVDTSFPSFPNLHLRSNAFLIRREHAEFLPLKVPSKEAAWAAESGQQSLSRRLLDLGLTLIIVGRNGRGYPPTEWGQSETFRQGTQSNLLIHDNVTRTYENAPFQDKRSLTRSTWGAYASDLLQLKPLVT